MRYELVGAFLLVLLNFSCWCHSHKQYSMDSRYDWTKYLDNSYLFHKEQDQQPPSNVAKPHAEIPAKVPPEKTNGTTEEKAEAKKNKRERKEERQKNRKKEKKELKSENQQENLRDQKSKKRKKGQEAGQEAGGEETAEADGPPEKKKARGGQASEEDADRNGAPGENADEGQIKTGKGKQKRRKHSEGVCSARTLGSLRL